MKVIADFKEKANRVRKAIARHGHNVEHNLYHYLAMGSLKRKLIFYSFPKLQGVLASREKDRYDIFPEGVLAPKQKRIALLSRVIGKMLSQKSANKVVVEVNEITRKGLLEWVKASKGYRALSTNFILHWPIFDMALFDAKLPGRRWKKMRNIRNRFIRQHRIRMVDSRKVPKRMLEGIVSNWLRKRKHSDTVEKEYYYNIIASGFKGFRFAKTLYVDGEPCTITAGWDVPNGQKHYYSAIGILNYRHPGLGEFANLMDLLHLKRKGYKLVDFGGSDKSLLAFKSKFRPTSVYKTYSFSIVRRK